MPQIEDREAGINCTELKDNNTVCCAQSSYTFFSFLNTSASETDSQVCRGGSRFVGTCIGILIVLVLVGIGVGVYFGVTLSTPECDIKHCSNCKGERCLECDNGWFGPTCEQVCRNCEISGCDKANGICIECYPGFHTIFCNKRCPGGCMLGSDERKHCDRESGICLECSSGFWGETCTKKCGTGCHTCNQDTGVCVVCAKGFKGAPTCEFNCDNCKDEHCIRRGNYFICDKGCIGGLDITRLSRRMQHKMQRGILLYQWYMLLIY